MVGYIPCILFKFYLKDCCCLMMADSFWILLFCIVSEQGIDRCVEMEFHLSCLYSSLRVCLYVEKETGALAVLFGHKTSYVILEYLSSRHLSKSQVWWLRGSMSPGHQHVLVPLYKNGEQSWLVVFLCVGYNYQWTEWTDGMFWHVTWL